MRALAMQEACWLLVATQKNGSGTGASFSEPCPPTPKAGGCLPESGAQADSSSALLSLTADCALLSKTGSPCAAEGSHLVLHPPRILQGSRNGPLLNSEPRHCSFSSPTWRSKHSHYSHLPRWNPPCLVESLASQINKHLLTTHSTRGLGNPEIKFKLF